MHTNSHKQAAKRSIYYIRKYFSRNTISEILPFGTPYRLSNDPDNIYTREFTFGNKYEFYEYLASHIWDSSGFVLCEHQLGETWREAFNILHKRTLLAEYNLRDIWISLPVLFSNKWWTLLTGNQGYTTFIHASLLLGNKYELYVYLTSLIWYSSGLLLCEQKFT